MAPQRDAVGSRARVGSARKISQGEERERKGNIKGAQWGTKRNQERV